MTNEIAAVAANDAVRPSFWHRAGGKLVIGIVGTMAASVTVVWFAALCVSVYFVLNAIAWLF